MNILQLSATFFDITNTPISIILVIIKLGLNFISFLSTTANCIITYVQPSIVGYYFNFSFNYGIKFLIALLFLIFIRAGIPRYRYDFLTILG